MRHTYNVRIVIICFALLAYGLAVCAVFARDAKRQAVKEGDKAPDFSLPNQSGELTSLSQFAGQKAVVLYFYPKDETQICTAEACAFRDSFQNFADLGAVVIGVSSDSVASHKQFAEHHQLPFLLVSDPNGELRQQYGVRKTMGTIPGRVTYVIDKNQVVRYVFNSQMQGKKHVAKAEQTLRKLLDRSDPQ